MDASGQRPVYPPSALILLLPLALLSWKTACFLFTAVCSLATLAVFYWLALHVGESWSDPRRLCMAAFALALAPVHTAIAVGNLSAATFPLCCVAMLLACRSFGLSAGVVLAVVLCIKPSSGFAVLAYALWLGRWRMMASAAAVAGMVFAVSLLAMRRIDPVWQADYRANVEFVFGPGGAASYQPVYANCLNLQNPLFSLLHNATATELLTWSCTSALALLWVFRFFRTTNAPRQWTWSSMGFWGLLALLPVYQRNYTAGVIVVALVWAFGSLDQRAARLALWLSVPFLVPGNHILYQWAYLHNGWPFERSGVYRAFVICHITWCIVALVSLLLVYDWKANRIAVSRQQEPGMAAQNA